MVHKTSEPDATLVSLGNFFFLFISVHLWHPLIKPYESLLLAKLTRVLYFRFSLAPTFASHYNFFIVQHSKERNKHGGRDIANGHSDVDLIISTCMGRN